MTAEHVATLNVAGQRPASRPVLVRDLIGESLREERVAQGRTLREVSTSARVSLGYLSEVERGQKEASSELLAAICGALDRPLSSVLHLVSEKMAEHERYSVEQIRAEEIDGEKVMALPLRPMARAAA